MSIGRPKSAATTNVPGPGQYNRSSYNRPTSPHYKIGTSKRDYDPIQKAQSINPGPNNYNPKIMQKTCPPQWLFGSGKRPPLMTPNSTPGPGNYNTFHQFPEGPKVIIIMIILI